MSDPFPFTSSGSQWQGILRDNIKDRTNGSLTRETVDGKLANVLRGKENGSIGMATDLALNPAEDMYVHATDFDGVELEVWCENGAYVEHEFQVS